MSPAEILSLIWSRCIPVGDCLLWDGGTDSDGRAQIRIPGKKGARTVRREVLQAMGVSCKGLVATCTCEEPLCMAPEHVVAWTRKKLQQRTMAKLAGDIRISASVAAVRRRSAKLDAEKVREIRGSDLTNQEWADRLGVDESTVSKARRGDSWKEYGGAAASLLAMSQRRQAA